MSSKRPEHLAPPEVFYNEIEAKKYTSNTRMIEIQNQMTERALELLNLPADEPCFLLDVGCGSGLSGEVLTENGHYWIGFDISKSMLEIACEREVKGDLLELDAGMGVPFKPGSFDACVSISALQWLCNADKKWHNPIKRLQTFFSSLYSVLVRGGKAVFQFYPDSPDQVELITLQAMKSGFTGGVVVDYPNSSRAKKMFLCLFAGVNMTKLPQALGTDDSSTTIDYTNSRQSNKFMIGKPAKKSKAWIVQKKDRRKRQGKDVRADSKYSGRKRKPQF
ncbi:probable 18S rRNA (guanine-N(7))-methyltransferase isoform X2 [Hydra vulgaris]|uniref:Probable 18S rRNA (Guanine-N(7))-methyltransferase isoform X2 n=1 Tax=Hydra vulgaris TaxID=6087 RepID=A0ABM4CNP8_HYDVU